MIRKRTRLAADQYRGRRVYFLTLCCARRRPVFRSPVRAGWFTERLAEVAEDLGFLVHAWCVMPDHVHLLVEGATAASDLLAFAKDLKQKTAYAAKRTSRLELWQPRFYDHILRPTDSLDRVAWYIWMNPVRKGLCAEPEQYPFSGSSTVEWKRKQRPIGEWNPPWKQKCAGLKADAT